MESAPEPKPKVIPHIDARTLSEIALDNKQLTDKLKYNHMCMVIRKNELNEQKYKSNLEKILQKPRKTFAFRINIDKMTLDLQKMAFETVQTIIKSNNSKITKSFSLNNYIYLRTNHSITISNDKISLPTGHVMEQICPKDIININLK